MGKACTNVVEAVVEASRWKKSKAWIQKRKKEENEAFANLTTLSLEELSR